MTDLIISLTIFVFIISIMIILRLKLLKNVEVKQSDILLAIIPIVLWLLLSGRIEKFEFGDLKIQTAFLEASKTPVTKQITSLKLPVETIRMDPKMGVEQIPRLIRNKTEALFFKLGYGGYYGPAIEDYLSRLSQYPFFKYVIIIDENDNFFGIADAIELNSIFKDQQANFNSYDFEKWLNNSDTTSLKKLPNYIPARFAIKKDTKKQEVLEIMEKLNVEILPVIDDKGRFGGIVDRSRITASLIIDVANKVE